MLHNDSDFGYPSCPFYAGSQCNLLALYIVSPSTDFASHFPVSDIAGFSSRWDWMFKKKLEDHQRIIIDVGIEGEPYAEIVVTALLAYIDSLYSAFC